jgi:hypothetical protein
MSDSVETPKRKPVGSAKTELIIGSAVAGLNNALKAFTSATSTIDKFQEQVDQLTLIHTELETKIENLEQEKKNKIAQNNLDLKIAYDTDRAKFAADYATSMRSTIVETSVFEQMKSKIIKLESEFKAEVDNAIKGIQAAAEAKALADMNLYKAERSAEEAETKAELKSLQARLDAATKEIESWKKALEDERSASVERAKAGAINTLNVGAARA